MTAHLPLAQHPDGMGDDPAVEHHADPVALDQTEHGFRQQLPALVIAHPQQHFIALGAIAAQADHRLKQQVHPLLLHGFADLFQQTALPG